MTAAFRFLHAADLHLDSPFRGMAHLPAVIRERLRQSTFDALNNLVELAIREQVDFILIGGDVYDLADRSLRAQIRFQKAVERLAGKGIPVYAIHGNHDPADGRAARLDWPESVRFFAAGEVESVPVAVPGKGTVARIYGISYPTAAVTANYASLFRRGDDAVFHIGLLHTNVDGDGGHANYAPCTRRELLAARMDYWALGHVHTRRVLHEDPPIVYPGNLQGRSIREIGPKGCYLVDVPEYGKPRLSFHATDAVRWFAMPVSIEGLQTEQALKERLEEILEQAREESDGRPSVVRIVLTGRGPLHPLLQKGSMLKELSDELCGEEALRAEAGTGHFAWIESVEVKSGMDVDRDKLAEQPHFLGDMLRMSDGLLADEPRLAEFCGEMLEPLFGRSRIGKYLPWIGPEEMAEWLKAAQEMAIEALAAETGWDE